MTRSRNFKNVWEVVQNEETGELGFDKQIARSFYTLTGIGISSLDTKLFWVRIHKKQNKIHYIILLVIVAKVITSLRGKI